MYSNFTSMITSIRKETERLKDNLINNTNLPTPTSASNLSTLFQNTLLFGNANSKNDGGSSVNTALLRKRLESGFDFDLTVDTRKIRPNIRQNYSYPNNYGFGHNIDDKIHFENPILRNVSKERGKQVPKLNDNVNVTNSNINRRQNERFKNFQIKTLNNLQDQNSDLSLAEELFMAELKQEQNQQNVDNNNRHFHNRRFSDRDEIRRRLAAGESLDTRKQNRSVQSRLQSGSNGIGSGGNNLQVCFMNETASDDENDTHHHQSLPCFDLSNRKVVSESRHLLPTNIALSYQRFKPSPPFWGEEEEEEEEPDDFFGRQAKLQEEARQSLVEAKEIAKLQLNQERAIRAHSPVAEMVARSLAKTGGCGDGTSMSVSNLTSLPRRASKTLLAGLNVAQLEVIVNDFHSHIEKLNEILVSMLVERDDLNMEQDSMLVDIEDLTRYLAAKHNSPHQSLPVMSASQSILGRKSDHMKLPHYTAQFLP